MPAAFTLKGSDVARLKVALTHNQSFRVDGLDISGAPGTPGEPGAPGTPGEPGAPGADGTSLLPSYTVSGVPAQPATAGTQIFVTDEAGGAVPAFSDGANWRRCTDRAIIS